MIEIVEHRSNAPAHEEIGESERAWRYRPLDYLILGYCQHFLFYLFFYCRGAVPRDFGTTHLTFHWLLPNWQNGLNRLGKLSGVGSQPPSMTFCNSMLISTLQNET